MHDTDRDGELWLRQLPPHALSPFDVFCRVAAQQSAPSPSLPRLACRAGVAPADVGAALPPPYTTGGAAGLRELAQTWLHLDPAQRGEYEEYAVMLSKNTPSGSSDGDVGASPVTSSQAPNSWSGSLAVSAVSAAAAAQTASSAAPRAVQVPVVMCNTGKRSTDAKGTDRPQSGATQRARTVSRARPSFYFFVQHHKGQHLKLRKLSSLWWKMTAEEKLPFDVLAAEARTAQLMAKE